MKDKYRLAGRSTAIWLILLFLCVISTTYSCVLDPGKTHTTDDIGPVTMRMDYLMATKAKLESGDPVVSKAYDNLIREANLALKKGPYSVVYKKLTPPSGNKHDYMSLATYAWPNPNTQSGLPYLIRDGYRNPEVDKYDRVPLARMSHYSRILALAYFFSEDEKYAGQAAQLIKHWFLDKDTYMKPNFEYTQVVPGVNEGGNQGIVESRDLVLVIDAVSLIYDSKHWTKKDQWELKLWFDNFLGWIQRNFHPTSYENNIATWHDLQIVSFALFSEQYHKIELSQDIRPNSRISTQITSTGTQPNELSRWKSQHYTYFNLKGLIMLATAMSKQDINLWNFSPSEEVGSIRKALDWLLPFASGEKQWDYPQVEPFNECRYMELYRPAALIYNDLKYETVVQNLLNNGCLSDETLLLYPKPNF